MRTKTLVLTAALAAAGAASAMAQNVYSVNAVGYVNKSIQSGFSLVANPFVVADESLDALLPTPPEGTTIYKLVGTTYQISQYQLGAWDPDGSLTLNLGGGVIIYNGGAPFNITFVGEVKQGTPVSNPVAAGLSVMSSKVPQAGALSALGFNPTAGTTIYQFDSNGTYLINQFDSAFGWDPGEPSVGIAEAFYIDSAAVQAWNRNFSVN